MTTAQLIRRDATERSPRVLFDPAAGVMELAGESYPEDAAAFFGPIMMALADYLAAGGSTTAPRRLTVDLTLNYFNSSSAKALMNMFTAMETAAREGRATVEINWHFHPDDETMEEFGEDFSEDFEAATFTLKPSEEV